MTVLAKIKEVHLAARKARQSDIAASLSTLIGDIEAVGKNAGREATDAEAIAIIKKFINNVDQVIKVAPTEGAVGERILFSSFLPKQLSQEELAVAVTDAIQDIGATTPKEMGKVINFLKTRYEGRFDGGDASKLIKAALSS